MAPGQETRKEGGGGGEASSINSVENFNLEIFGVEVYLICFRICKGLQKSLRLFIYKIRSQVNNLERLHYSYKKNITLQYSITASQ